MAAAKNMIDKNLPVPLYYQLKNILLEEINHMEPDEMVDTESTLISKYQVSRTTVRQAIAELVKENYLYTIRGKGTFVAARKVDLGYMNKIESFNDQVRQSGRVPSTRVLLKETAYASGDMAALLNISDGDEVIRLKRLRYADNEPIALAESYLPLPLCEDLLDVDFTSVSLYQELDKDKDTEVRHVRRYINACEANDEEAILLNLKSSERVLLKFITVAYTSAEVPIEYCISKYRVDKNSFVVDLHR